MECKPIGHRPSSCDRSQYSGYIQTFLNEIMIEIAWQSLIFSFFSDKIILNEKEIDDQFNKIIESKKNLEEYNLAEIEIILDNKDD